MADLLGLLPFFGRQNPWTDPAQGADPNEILPATERTTIAGLPITPMLGGLAVAGLGRLLAGKNYDKNQSMIQGFMLGQRAFNQPIAEEEQARRQMQRDMINKGWFTPFGSSPAAGAGGPTPPTGIQEQDLGTSTAAAPPMPTAAPPSRYMNVNGMRLNLAPSAAIGDLLPNLKLPGSVAGMQLPMSAELVNMAAEGGKEQAMRDYYNRLGYDPNMPLSVAAADEAMKQKVARVQAAVKGLPPPGEFEQVQTEINENGIPTQTRTALAPGIERARIEQQQAAARLQTLQEETQQKTLALAEEKLNLLKDKKDQLTPQEMNVFLEAARIKLNGLNRQLEKLPKDALSGQFTPESQAEAERIRTQIDTVQNEMSTAMKGYGEKTGVPTAATPTPEDPAATAFNIKRADYAASFKAALNASKKPLSLAAMETLLPPPTDPREKQAFQEARDHAISVVTPIVERIRTHMKGRTGMLGYGKGSMDRQVETAFATQYGDWWPIAKRAYEAE